VLPVVARGQQVDHGAFRRGDRQTRAASDIGEVQLAAVHPYVAAPDLPPNRGGELEPVGVKVAEPEQVGRRGVRHDWARGPVTEPLEGRTGWVERHPRCPQLEMIGPGSSPQDVDPLREAHQHSLASQPRQGEAADPDLGGLPHSDQTPLARRDLPQHPLSIYRPHASNV